METLQTRVWEYSLNNPQGFTLNIHTLKPATAGICVAYEATQDSHGRESLETVIGHALAHEGFVGGWLNVANGRYYFDSVRIFPETMQAEAEAFARENEQIGYFIISTKTFVEIK